MKGEIIMTEVIVFLITFTAAALAIAVIALAAVFVMTTKNYQVKNNPKTMLKEKEES